MRVVRRIVVALILVVGLVWLLSPAAGPQIEPGSILLLELSGSFVEAPEPPILGRLLSGGRRPLVSLLSELAKARRDDRVAGVVLRIRRMGVGWGMAQEIRHAIEELEKPTLAYLEVESTGANIEYYIATAAQRIHAGPGAASPLIGLAAQYLFLGGLWEKLGAGMEAIGSGEYKSGADTLAGRSMTEAHREMANSLLDSTYDQFVSGIAQGRGLTDEFVRATVDNAPASPQELRALGLIDEISFLGAAVKSLGDGPLVKGAEYARVDPSEVGFEPVAQFALVYGSGTVVVGAGSVSRTGDPRLASDSVGEALEDASKDDSIDAIIFRIDSPGGSPLASDIIWHATQRARERGKPLIASVSNYAASGGYYVACGADAIVASPGSLLGSIGVFALRPTFGGLLEKLGIGVEVLTRGARADLLATSKPLTEAGRELLLQEIAAIYDLFVERVSAGRGLTREQVHEIGRGRVWTGAQAAENGLVDELGGLRTAVQRGKAELGLDPEADVALIPYPAPRSLVEQLDETLRRLALRASPAVALSASYAEALPALIRRLEPLLEAVPLGAPALLPPLVIEIR